MASFLDLFPVVDSDGVSAARYRLYYLGNSLVNQDSWIFGMLTQLVYMLFQLIIVPANALLGFVLNSSAWLDPLAGFYQRLTAPIYAVFPPWAIACLGLGLVAFSTLRAKPRFTADGFSSEIANRIGAAIAMATAVLVLTNNPFAMIAKVLELANGFSLGLAGAVTGNGDGSLLTAGQSLVDASIRTPTIALNYGSEMTAACSSQWSEAMLAGNALAADSGCFTKGSDAATPGSLLTAVLMLLLPALPMLVFCVVAAWKYLVHLSMSALCLVATGWVAAVSVHKRRGFENLSAAFAHAAAHLAMAVLTSMLAVALPVTCAGLGTELLGIVTGPQAQAYVLMVSLGVGFAASAWAIIAVTSTHGVLVRALKADANTNLEKLFGLTPKKLEFGFANVSTLLRGGKVPEESGASRTRGRKSVLSDDPKASTAAAAPEGADRAAASSTSDSAVTQLMAAAQSVAGAPTGAPAAASPAGGSGTAAASRPRAVVVVGTTTESAPADPAAAAAMWADAPAENPGDASVPAATTASTAAAATPPVSTDMRVVSVAAEPAPVTGGTTGSVAEPGAEQNLPVLADASTFAPPQDVAGPPPVVGLLGADPALEAVARESGTTFVATEPPKPERRLSSLLRRFRRGPVEPAPVGAVPEITYGAPLEMIPLDALNGNDAVVVDVPPDGNDQQRWNRLRRLRGAFQRKSAATGGAAENSADDGERPHPASFIAPMQDFLAGDALAADIDEFVVTSGAAGVKVDVRISPSDPRLGLQFSSDPDERVRSSNGSGFGDPV